MIKDTIIGIAIIIFGCYAIYSTNKKPNKISWSSNLKGYVAGACFIFIGVIYLLRKLHIVNW